MISIVRPISALCSVLACLAQPAPPRYSITAAAGSAHVTGDNGPATSAVLRKPQYIAIDRAGNLYVSEGLGYTIRKVAPDGTITTVAGTGVAASGPDGAPAVSSPLGAAEGVALDNNGNVYLAELYLRKISPSGVLSTIAKISGIQGISFDQAGNLYVADTGNSRIRKIDANNTVTTIAGTGAAGFSGDGGPAVAAQLNQPSDVVADAAGNVYIADRFNNRIRKITPDGTIATYAGNGTAGSAGDNGSAATAQLNNPAGLALDSAGHLYVSEFVGNRVRRITSTAAGASIETVAGTGAGGFLGDNGLAVYAEFDGPWGIAIDAAGNLYVADGGASQRIRKVTPTGIISTFAGASHFAGDGGPASSARLAFPESVAADNLGNLYIADRQNHRIRKITPDGAIRTIAGNGRRDFSGDGAPAIASTLNAPAAVAVDAAGNIYIADTGNSRVRMIDSRGFITTIAGNGIANAAGDGGPAISAGLNLPKGVAVDSAGNVYIADQGNNRIRMVNPKGIISTVAGTGVNDFAGDSGPATAAQLSDPAGVALDSAGNLYIADTANYRVRRVDSARGQIFTVIGNGQVAYSGDGGPAAGAALQSVPAIAVDSTGQIFIADPGNGRIRMVNTSGTISTIAGSGTRSSTGDGGLATSATLGAPVDTGYGIAVGPGGVVYFADYIGEEIRKLTPNIASQLKIVSGNNQSGAATTQLPNPLLVSPLDSVGVPVPGVAVTFTVTAGSAQLSAASVVTDSNGQAAVTVTMGSAPGPVTVTAAAAGIPSVIFNLTATAPPANTGPQISPGGVVGAGLSVPLVTQVSPNAIVSIFGQNFAPPGSPLSIVGAADLVAGKLPTQFAGVCVEVNAQRAPIFLVSPGQLNIQIPAIPQSGTVTVQVIANCGQSTEARSATVTVPAQAATPEFFFFEHNANGQNPVAAVYAGDIVSIFMTGLGPTNPPYDAGVLPPAAAALTTQPTVTLGAQQLPPANILYAGVAPLNPGLYQINIQLPPTTPTGNIPLTVTVGPFTTPAGAYLSITQ